MFGPALGFLLGSTALLTSALLTGGVGPWLPFQMLAASDDPVVLVATPTVIPCAEDDFIQPVSDPYGQVWPMTVQTS